jgi:hypothetical protein
MKPTQEMVGAPFERNGFVNTRLPADSVHLSFLRSQREFLVSGISKSRPWYYAELHNPWSPAAKKYDSWGFLDLCCTPEILDWIEVILGPDLILFDSHWVPDFRRSTRDWSSDAHRLPVEPQVGVTALLSLSEWQSYGVRFECLPGSHRENAEPSPVFRIQLRPGDLVILDPRLQYRISGEAWDRHPIGYAIRYFPATSRYLRRRDVPLHRHLSEMYPLINYAQFPLWLVRGRDRADNDFVTGFNPRAGRWAAGATR